MYGIYANLHIFFFFCLKTFAFTTPKPISLINIFFSAELFFVVCEITIYKMNGLHYIRY